jgi:oligopeptide transport system permease protein
MTKFILWRLVQFPFVLAAIYLATFLLVWIAPGSPFEGEKKLDPVVEAELKKQYFADSPLHFLSHYPVAMLHGEFGPSLSYQGWSVGAVMKSALPISITLGMFALTIATLGGATLGTFAAVRRGGAIDWINGFATLLGVSLPGFVAAGLLLVIFSDKLHWLPSGGWGGIRHLILPAVALSLAPLAYIAQLTRVSMLDVHGEDYVRTARSSPTSALPPPMHSPARSSSNTSSTSPASVSTSSTASRTATRPSSSAPSWSTAPCCWR